MVAEKTGVGMLIEGTMHSPVLDGYQAALSSAAFFEANRVGRVVLRDRDRADLLNRLSTNNILKLQPGQGIRTVLTNHNGRIIDLLTVCVLPEELLLLCSPGQGPAIARLFRKNIFFNDRLVVEDRSSASCQFMLYGPQAPAVLQQLVGVDCTVLPRFAIHTVDLHGRLAFVVRDLPIGGEGFALIAEQVLSADLTALLERAGASVLQPEAYEVLRVEQGYGSFGHELSLEYIPLEAGLHDAISFSKGCYIGQEIIARMESRNRLAKHLRGLRLSAPAVAPSKLDVGGKESGDMTSVVVSPRFGPIALAYVRTAHAQPGTVVGIANSDITGEVVELPFC